jgi:excisionase family DNA binding protein
MTKSEWVTPADAAGELGYSARWVRHQIEEGRLKAYAFTAGSRRTLRIRREDLEAFRKRYVRDALD